MKRFSFNLEKVLALRKFRENESKTELGRVIAILAGIENEIKINAQSKKTAAVQRFAGVGTDTFIADPEDARFEMQAWDNYIARLDLEAERLLKRAAEAELVVEEKREIYLEASRDLKVMEKLREKRVKEYRKEYFAEETHELEDLRRGGEGRN
ncbi:MAG: flagellar export protein FliJ [Treponema sp.]|nr:flagellar export protein FliJ [Treponema sp.]